MYVLFSAAGSSTTEEYQSMSNLSSGPGGICRKGIDSGNVCCMGRKFARLHRASEADMVPLRVKNRKLGFAAFPVRHVSKNTRTREVRDFLRVKKCMLWSARLTGRR